MKKYIKISAIVLTGILLAISGNIQQAKAATSSNLFSTLLGKSETEVQARIDSVWTHFFTPGDISKYDADGEKCVYYEVGDSMGIIVDTGSNDVRTEGMAGANAVGVFALADSDSKEDRALAREYVQRLWDVEPPTGKWRYYVGMVYFLSMLHVSGNFSL